jgi:hypothetical protein
LGANGGSTLLAGFGCVQGAHAYTMTDLKREPRVGEAV